MIRAADNAAEELNEAGLYAADTGLPSLNKAGFRSRRMVCLLDDICVSVYRLDAGRRISSNINMLAG